MRQTLEWLLFAAGLIILAGCVVVLWLRDARSDTLIDRFEAAKVEVADEAVRPAPAPAPVVLPEPVPAPPAPDLSVLPPDQSDWSPYRRKRYTETQADEALPLAVLRIPAIDLQVPVLAGSDTPQLERGVGWLTRTAPLGASGNAALAGHRDSFFRKLGRLAPGDIVRVDTLEGVIEYRVTGHRIVEPHDVSVLRPVEDRATLTLITCYPFRYVGRAPQRYVVHAERTL